METQSYAECLKKIEQIQKEEAEKAVQLEVKKKKVKKVAIIGLLAALACAAVILLITLVIVPATTVLDGPFTVGNTIVYGNYQNEDIEWQILARKGNKALLISKYCLDCKPYNTEKADVTWKTSSLRNWLNGSFYYSAFNSGDRKSVLTTTVKADKNPDYHADPGNNTKDKVFLLSIKEAEMYFGNNGARQASSTEYAKSQRIYLEKDGNSAWWLRSPGYDSSYAALVNHAGYVGTYGDSARSGRYGVRPALWVDITKLAS